MIAGARQRKSGRAVADRLIAEGAVVVGIDREDHTTGSSSIIADLSAENESSRCLRPDFTRKAGHIDFLYNNAGAVSPRDKTLVNRTSETLDQIFAANFLNGLALLQKPRAHWMLKNNPPSGSIVNSSSFLANMGSATRTDGLQRRRKRRFSQFSRDLGT